MVRKICWRQFFYFVLRKPTSLHHDGATAVIRIPSAIFCVTLRRPFHSIVQVLRPSGINEIFTSLPTTHLLLFRSRASAVVHRIWTLATSHPIVSCVFNGRKMLVHPTFFASYRIVRQTFSVSHPCTRFAIAEPFRVKFRSTRVHPSTANRTKNGSFRFTFSLTILLIYILPSLLLYVVHNCSVVFQS